MAGIGREVQESGSPSSNKKQTNSNSEAYRISLPNCAGRGQCTGKMPVTVFLFKPKLQGYGRVGWVCVGTCGKKCIHCVVAQELN